MNGSDGDCSACRGSGAGPGETDVRTGARLSRRAALRLGGAAGVAAAVSSRLSPLGALARGRASRETRIEPVPDWPAPPIVTRAQWGADESIREAGQIYDPVVEKIVVHHTVTPNHPTDPAATVRSVYNYHVSGEYIDVAYNWLIDEQGRIYEGRWARDYPGGVTHTGERRSRQVRGGHAYLHNSRTIGIAMLGTWTTTLPPQPAIDALETLIAWKCARWGIDPRGSSSYLRSDGVVEYLPNIIGHRDVRATTCPGDPILGMLPGLRDTVAAGMKRGRNGYWIVSSAGGVIPFGDLADRGDLVRLGVRGSIVGMAAHPGGRGYWLLGSDGGIFAFGAARFFGSTGGMRLDRPVVGMAATPSGKGYWLVASDGGIFSFGDARFFGSTGGMRLDRPVVGMAATPSGKGYWLVASDGGIFSFGDARFFGSTGGMRLDRPVVGMAATPSGKGYWLVASDGGIFTFGKARFHGSAQTHHPNAPVVDILATTTGDGYAILSGDGGVYTFGDARYLGASAGRLRDAVGIGGLLGPRA
ncbi:MAG: peptidoglycan recognition protein family protein [Acidimicrobiia bacterium]|nr:peptidoglycan recognition protein family protein [Acidimicrobiia bacterium]